MCCIGIFIGFAYFFNKIQMEQHRERNQEMAKQAQTRTEENKKNLEEKTRFEEMMGQVQELNALGKYDEAAKTASEAVQLDPKNARAYTWWGLSLAKAGRVQEAYKKFDQSARLDPNQTKNYYYWGLTLVLEGKNEEAIDKFENALLLDPENSKVSTSWGAALNNLGRHDEAIKKLEEALAQNSFDQQAYGVLVDAYFHKGQYQQAWDAVARARKNKITIAAASLKRLSDASPEPH